jgi:trimethylamine--corrinoid protein Co-methyltransferase
VESALALSTAVRNGVNFILHTAGILGSYIAMSYEKFLLDEELAGLLQKMIKPIEITPESIDVEMIQQVGIGGQYLTQPKTFQLCRTEFYLSDLMNRQNHTGWAAAGGKRIDQTATDLLDKRLSDFEKPELDPSIEEALAAYVAGRKAG